VPPNTNKDVDFEVRCEKAGGKTHKDPLDARERASVATGGWPSHGFVGLAAPAAGAAKLTKTTKFTP
jgi:hypothetical protein